VNREDLKGLEVIFLRSLRSLRFQLVFPRQFALGFGASHSRGFRMLPIDGVIIHDYNALYVQSDPFPLRFGQCNREKTASVARVMRCRCAL